MKQAGACTLETMKLLHTFASVCGITRSGDNVKNTNHSFYVDTSGEYATSPRPPRTRLGCCWHRELVRTVLPTSVNAGLLSKWLGFRNGVEFRLLLEKAVSTMWAWLFLCLLLLGRTRALAARCCVPQLHFAETDSNCVKPPSLVGGPGCYFKYSVAHSLSRVVLGGRLVTRSMVSWFQLSGMFDNTPETILNLFQFN